jgi:inhibitor of cysteine peptidase
VVELTEKDSGTRRTAQVGEDIVVTLAENPTTGYRWAAQVDASTLAQTDDSYTGASTPRGAGGMRRLTFTALRAGTIHLRLVKKRAWEHDGDAEQFSVDLDVRP